MILDDGVNPPIQFTDELVWEDEFAWSPVVQSKKFAIGGSLVIQEAQKQAGRPITLTGSSKVWEKRSVVEALFLQSILPNKQYNLTLHDNRTFTVMFNKVDESPVKARPCFEGQDEDPNDQYEIEALRFIEV